MVCTMLKIRYLLILALFISCEENKGLDLYGSGDSLGNTSVDIPSDSGDPLPFGVKIYPEEFVTIEETGEIRLSNRLSLQGLLSFAQPFSESGYKGKEAVTQEFLDAREDIVDWVLVTVIDKNKKHVLYKAAYLITTTGDVVTYQGHPPKVPLPIGKYYLKIEMQRHHVVRSTQEMTLKGLMGGSFDATLAGKLTCHQAGITNCLYETLPGIFSVRMRSN